MLLLVALCFELSFATLYSERLVQNSSSSCSLWRAFLDSVSLTPGAYKRVSIKEQSGGVAFACDNQSFVDALALSMRNRTPFARTCSSDGSMWSAAMCGVTRELASGPMAFHTCAITTRVSSVVDCWG